MRRARRGLSSRRFRADIHGSGAQAPRLESTHP